MGYDPAQGHDRELPEDDDRRRPDRYPIDRHQGEKSAGDHDLVGRRVEKGTEHRPPGGSPRPITVEKVGE